MLIATYKPDSLFLEKVDEFNQAKEKVEQITIVDYGIYDDLSGFGGAIAALRDNIDCGVIPDMYYWSLQAGVNGFDSSLFCQSERLYQNTTNLYR